MDRQKLREQELAFLDREKEKYPQLFEKIYTTEDAAFLADYGIHIPGKERFPKGFVKVLPSDFIVEEVSASGALCTINFPEEKDAWQTGTRPQDPKNSSVYATLVKCGISTIEAVDDMCKKLGFRPGENNAIGYAGIKDKEAITSQEISFRGVSAEDVSKIRSNEYFLKDIRPGKSILMKGSLQKNKFTILVRSGDLGRDNMAEVITRQIADIKQNGFYNYYYLQRFGNPRLINFVWGIHIIKGEYRETVEHYLSYAAPRELEYFKGIRRKIGTIMGNWDEIAKILEPLPLIFWNELRIVNYLRNRPGDYLGALLTIPEQILLWVYAVPSLLFNEKISNLLQRGRPVPPTLPLILSENPADIEMYREELQAIGLYPLKFNHLKPFRNIFIKSRSVSTRERVEFHAADVINEGLLISFSLGKGEYATTFLSHIFNLAPVPAESEISNNTLDCKAILEGKSNEKTLQLFAEQIALVQKKEKE